MNNLGILQALIFEPRRGFAELDARPRFWWPLLLLIIAQVTLSVWYVSYVDLEWLVDQQLRASAAGANLTDEEIARLASQSAAQGRGVRAVITGVASAIVLPLVLLLGACYYLLATKITGVERSFRHWFTLSCWTTLPVVLVTVLLGALALVTAGSNQVPQAALQPLSLNELVFHREPTAAGYTLFNSLNVLQLVSIYLSAMGLKVWTARSWTYCIIVAALPLVLIYGIWAFFALR